MKTLKRILALMAALVLCLAPMALMVGAAETEIDLCSSDRNYPCIFCGERGVSRSLANATLVEKQIVGTQSICFINWYTNVEYYCVCGELKLTDDVGIEYTHPTFFQNTVSGYYYCPECKIVKTW